jgi:RNA polymerase sigma-70 factor, ECF subfamily
MMSSTSVKNIAADDLVSIDQESQWIQAAQRGDLQAFNNLVLAYQEHLYNWSVYLMSDPDLASDLTQTVFITAYEKIKTFRNGSFRSWLFQIAKNRSIDHHRNQQRHIVVSLNDTLDDDNEQEWVDWVEDKAPIPSEQIEQREQANLVHQLLQRLPEEYRSALVLVDMEELDYAEVARVLNIPLGTVKSRVARARLKLRSLLVNSGQWLAEGV